MPASKQLLISGYTEDGYGAGPGLQRFSLTPDGLIGESLTQSSGVVNPSFIAHGAQALLAVEERANGSVVALDPESLAVLARASSGGADPCHILYREGEVWGANYSSGNAFLTSLSALLASTTSTTSTTPEPPVMFSHPGSGPVAGRQDESHAHQVSATPWETVMVTDLGADRVDEYALQSGQYSLLGSAELPPGTGPRHIAFKGDFLLVAGELDGYLHVLRRTETASLGGHSWKGLAKIPLAASAQAIELAEQFYPSHLQLSDDGSKLYAAVRGPNTLVVLDVSALGELTPPVFLAEVSCAGNWPRHFALGQGKAVGQGKIYVANQLSNNVTVFELDADGLPGAEPVQTLDFGSPTCVLLS